MKRKFIEYDLPLATISEESAREKNIRHGHPSTLHIWWARRPLASSRAALIDDPGPEHPEKRAEIMKLIEEITPWEAVKNGNSDAIRRAQRMISEQFGGTPPKVLDPFAGGAGRAGARVKGAVPDESSCRRRFESHLCLRIYPNPHIFMFHES